MKDLEVYLFQPEKFSDLIHNSKVVIDTNVLLAAYQYRDITFNELIKTLESLNNNKRLVIPSHVIKEFFKNRPGRIVEIIQTVTQVRDSQLNIKKVENIQRKIPSMEYLKLHSEITSAEQDLNSAIDEMIRRKKEYDSKLTELINELKSFFHYDPILEKYKKLFTDSYYKPDTLNNEDELLIEFKKREKLSVPPGYKDSQKTNNGEGDYIIWEHILQIKEDNVIFITADNKPDWVYKEPNDKVISARRELVEEFFQKSGGHSLCIVNPSIFLKEYNPSIATEIITDLDEKFREKNERITREIESLNYEGNSTVANSNYSRIIRSLFQENLPNVRLSYTVGDSPYLDQVLSTVAHDRMLYSEVLSRANKIAIDNNLSEKGKQEKYKNIAEWAIYNQQ